MVARPVELEAFEAMNAGDNCKVVALLHNVNKPGCALMRARAWTRLREFERALTECSSGIGSGCDPHENVQLLDIEAAILFSRSDTSFAYKILNRLKLAAENSKERIVVAYALQTEFWLACFAEDFARAHSTLKKLHQRLDAVASYVPRKFYHVHPEALRARVLNTEAYLKNFMGDFASLESCLLAAAMTSACARIADLPMEAQILTNLATTVTSIRSEPIYAYLTKRFATFPWTAHTDVSKSVVREALINGKRLYGFNLNHNITSRTAPTLSTRLPMVASKLLWDEWNDGRAFVEDSRFCVSLVLEINNTEVSGAELGVMLDSVAVLAALDRVLARRTWDIYRNRRLHLSRFLVPTHRPLFEARIRFVDACLAKADDDLPRALALYDEAFDIIRDADESPLAAIAGLERFSITRNPSDLEYARKFIVANPRARFSRRLSAALTGAESVHPNGFPYLGLYAPHGPNPAPLRAAESIAVSAG